MMTNDTNLRSLELKPNIHNEFSPLKTVVVGTADGFVTVPKPEECYDAHSYESVMAGVFPTEQDSNAQLDELVSKLTELGIEVLRPEMLDNQIQVFARDIAFVIDDRYVISSMIEERVHEQDAMTTIEAAIDKDHILRMPKDFHVEGGDVILHNEYVFVGVSDDATFQTYKTARTNRAGMKYLQEHIPDKIFKGFELLKDDYDPRKGSLHLDCAFQPIGKGALIAPHLFKSKADVRWLYDFFGAENCYTCSPEEAYDLATNVFSITPNEVVAPKSCQALQDWLRARGMIVHVINYDQIVKMGGLFRCTTMPLIRTE
jgi:N-dimethylarginine dimethylaminohydrolase